MEKYPSGSKLELTDCKIENGISVEVTKRKRKSTRERTTDRYYLLKSKKEISQPKVYVFVNDDEVGIRNSNPSKEFEEQTLDKMDFMI